MKNIIPEILKFKGRYEGNGINHEKEEFRGAFEIEEILAGAGATIKFQARSAKSPEVLFHSEVSTIAPNANGGHSLFNLNTNMPFMAEHILASANNTENGLQIVFRFGNIEDKKSFREEIVLDLFKNQKLNYRYSWGMPNGEFAERSGALMSLTKAQ